MSKCPTRAGIERSITRNEMEGRRSESPAARQIY
jgi:hypothetical protein